jgi:F0F1-type ATP synthase membrane subunit b/b'
MFTPKVERIFSERNGYVDSILNSANKLKNEAEIIDMDSSMALENAQIDSSLEESSLVSTLREQSLKEKNTLYALFSEKSKKESDLLAKSSEAAFTSILESNIDELVDAAVHSISSISVRNES